MNSLALTPQADGTTRVDLEQELGREHIVRITLHLHSEASNFPVSQLQSMVCRATAQALAERADWFQQQEPNLQLRDLRYG